MRIDHDATTLSAGTLSPGDRAVLRPLVTAQIFAGLGQSAGIAGALLAAELEGGAGTEGLPLAALILGSAAAVPGVMAVARRAGRRAGLAVALGVGAVGAAGVVIGAALCSLAVVVASCVLFGAGNTATMLARYAAAAVAPDGRRGRAMGQVVAATTVGAVAGPHLLAPAGDVATGLGLPAASGIFAVAAAAYLAAAAILIRAVPPAHETSGPPEHPAPQPAGQGPDALPIRAVAGLITISGANLVMVSVMALAPVHLTGHGHDLRAVGFALSLHLAAMFAPAPLVGRMTDRFGPVAVAAGGGGLLTLACLLIATADPAGPLVGASLVILGAGWNASLVAGSILLVSALEPVRRRRTEAVGEVTMAVCAGIATAGAGPVSVVAGYPVLAFVGAGAAMFITALLVLGPHRRRYRRV